MNKQILRLAIPNILSNISVPLLSIVDTALMGHLEKEIYIGAIAVGAGIFNFLYWGFGFLRMSTTGITAQAYGKEDQQTLNKVLLKGIRISLLTGLIFILLQIPIERLALYFIDAGEETRGLISEYFRIRIYAAPFTLLLYVFHGWFLGMQNARIPMVLTLAVNGFNIVFSLLFIKYFGMKSDGVAWGTVIAQGLGLVLAVGLFVRNYPVYYQRLMKVPKLMKIEIEGYWRNNIDIIVRTFCLIITINFIVFRSGSLGDRVLSVNALLLQLNYLMSYAVDGFAFAGESLAGLYIGRKDRGKFLQSIKLLMGWGVGFGTLFGLLYFFGGEYVLRILTKDQDLIDATAAFLPWFGILPILSAVAFVWDGVYLGATVSRPMRDSMIISTLVFLLGWYFFIDSWGNHGIWLAFSLFIFGRSLILTILAPKWLLDPKLFE